jgi:hypothetical protein
MISGGMSWRDSCQGVINAMTANSKVTADATIGSNN